MKAAQTRPLRVSIPIELHWNLPWHLDTFQGITDYGSEHGWDCVVDPFLDGPTGDGDLSTYDGVVGRITTPNSQRLQDLGLPAVNLHPTLVDLNMHCVLVDSVAGARLAAEHLVTHGYRRFGHVCSLSRSQNQSSPISSNQITQTFADTIESQGFAPPLAVAVRNDAFEQAETSKACLQTLADWIIGLDKPVGVYVYLFDIARYIAQICRQLGFRVPEDVGIVVQDADTMNTTRVTPTLSAIDFDFWEEGYQAAAVLDRLMRGERVEPRTKLITPRRVIVRESSDVFVCEDELVSQAMRFIAEHSRQTLRADEVAEALIVSRRTLDRRFEQARNKTISQEITRLRTDQLKRALIETKLPMATIAELYGFSNASHFTQFFSKQAGMPPSSYRKQEKVQTGLA